MKIDEKICPNDETLLSFIERKSDSETASRVLTHLEHCPQCKAALSFVCSAMVMERRNELPVLSPEDKQRCKGTVLDLLAKLPKKEISPMWADVLEKLLRLESMQFEPDVIAAGVHDRKLAFCSLQPRNSDTFWRAYIEMPKGGTDETIIKVEVNDAGKKPISKGVLSFCGISISILDGKGGFTLESFRKNHKNGGISFTWDDNRSTEGIPVLDSI